MYWKAFKLTPLDKEQKEALVVFFTSKSKKRFTKGRIKKKKNGEGTPKRTYPTENNQARKMEGENATSLKSPNKAMLEYIKAGFQTAVHY